MPEPVDWPTRDLVTHRVESTPERTAVVGEDGELTYRELDAAVADAASVFEAFEADRVATLVDTRAAVGTLLFGAMRAGATLAPLNLQLGSGVLESTLETLAPDLLVCERESRSLAVEAAPCPVVSLDGADNGDVDAFDDIAAAEPSPAPVEFARDDTQLVLFTSGTTSEPKGVRLTVGNLVASATASAFRLGVAPGDRWLVCLPTYHMGGLAPFVRSALYGTTVVVQRGFDAERTPERLAAERVTGVSLVPTMLTRLLDEGWTPHESLRVVLLGGGPASETLVDRCRERGLPVCPTYGMTETSSQIATARPETAAAYPGTVGQPLLCTEVRVVADGSPVGPGERGELVVSGPTVTPGYLDDARTEAAFGPHGFHTGDRGYRDDDGRLWVVGRVDDRIVTGGENVDAGDVAAAIREHQAVSEAAVVGLPDPEWGQRVAALVVGDVDEATVLAHCRDRLASYEVPKTIRVIESLPRTPSGTVDRGAVRDLLGG
ncbi:MULTISPECIES: class I adenylate-forming enzyme family protein [Haloarcula]|uniref:class I adenylate-forming enzyme family protein n=1 Tax=Haloarcula TaxID=2237 RepID=UPI0023EBF3EE|nr:AMP-binding protein [Halomicroarcula sp. XH51]